MRRQYAIVIQKIFRHSLKSCILLDSMNSWFSSSTISIHEFLCLKCERNYILSRVFATRDFILQSLFASWTYIGTGSWIAALKLVNKSWNRIVSNFKINVLQLKSITVNCIYSVLLVRFCFYVLHCMLLIVHGELK